MIKMMFGIKKLPGISEEQFHSYWREKHGVLAQKTLPDAGVSRYVQNHLIDFNLDPDPRGLQGMAEPFDGVVEIAWESLEKVQQVFADEKMQEQAMILVEDEKNFIDFSRSAMWWVEEEVYIGESAK